MFSTFKILPRELSTNSKTRLFKIVRLFLRSLYVKRMPFLKTGCVHFNLMEDSEKVSQIKFSGSFGTKKKTLKWLYYQYISTILLIN